MNTILMTTYMAGTILSQATFGTMTECVSARDMTLKQNSKELTVVCSYQGDAKTEFSNILKMFKDTMKGFQTNEQSFNNEVDKMFLEFNSRPKCGVLGVEPNEWIRIDPTNESSSYGPKCS